MPNLEPTGLNPIWRITVHAVFVTVRIDPAQYDEAMKGLRESVIPDVKSTPGFARGTWFGDTGTGHGVLVFESEEQAQKMAGMVSTPADFPVQVQDVKVYEVTAEA